MSDACTLAAEDGAASVSADGVVPGMSAIGVVPGLIADGVVPGLIADGGALRASMATLAKAGLLALDTEADGMFRYRARLCWVQLCADGLPGSLALIDALACADRGALTAALVPLLGPDGPEKVVHDLAFDARILSAHGIRLGRVFDTSVAARFLSVKATGLKALLLSELGVDLLKGHQQADWGERPLPVGADSYLADDVRYLSALHDRLLQRVRAADIEAEVREECAYLLDDAQRIRSEPTPFSRVSGTALMPPKQRARLFALLNAREEIGQRLDVPSGRVAPTPLLVSAAERGVWTPPVGLRDKLGEDAPLFADALARAEADTDAPESELARLFAPAPSPATLRRHKRRRALLTGFREREAKERGVDFQVVLPGHCLADMLHLPALAPTLLQTVRGLGECRIARYAARLQTDFAAHWDDE